MMKVVIGLQGAAPVAPDYAMLKAALIAAQAATPTARASVPTHATTEPRGALHALFAGDGTAIGEAAALGHRFGATLGFSGPIG